MKAKAKFIITMALVALGTSGYAKPQGAVDGVNRLAQAAEGTGDEVFSPAAAFFTLLMLGELDDGDTHGRIHGITMLSEWRGDETRKGGTIGWTALDHTFWIDRIDIPSQEGLRVVERFRGKVVPVDFWDAQDRKDAGLDLWFEAEEMRRNKSALLTEARYRPQWKYAMREAGKSVFRCEGGEKKVARYIQSRIIPVKVWNGDGLEFSLELEGGGEAFFSTGKGRWEGEPEVVEAIVFIPQASVSKTIDAGSREELGKAAGGGTTYSKLLGYGGLELSRWLLRSEIHLQAGGGPDWNGTAGARKAPVVLKIDEPFAYRVTGAHGETVMQGELDCVQEVEEKP